VQLDYVVLVMDLCNREGILYSLNTDPGP
jgi:hypothetical protein